MPGNVEHISPSVSDWEGDYYHRNQLLTCIGSLGAYASRSSATTSIYQGQSFSTGIVPEAAEAILIPIGEFYFYGDVWRGYLKVEKWPTTPSSSEQDTVEIVIDPAIDEFDLSLLGEREKEFFKSFVGAFDPGPNFTENDLTIDDLS